MMYEGKFRKRMLEILSELILSPAILSKIESIKAVSRGFELSKFEVNGWFIFVFWYEMAKGISSLTLQCFTSGSLQWVHWKWSSDGEKIYGSSVREVCLFTELEKQLKLLAICVLLQRSGCRCKMYKSDSNGENIFNALSGGGWQTLSIQSFKSCNPAQSFTFYGYLSY